MFQPKLYLTESIFSIASFIVVTNSLTEKGFVTHVSSVAGLILEKGRLKPDPVEVSMDLHARIGGIDTVNLMRDLPDVNAWFHP